MNYLAHAYLSFGHDEILAGNMISDFIKGKKKFDYPLNVQKGIELHRLIDNFTDDHIATKEAKQVFKSSVGLYAGAFTDVAYDHFLATDIQQFSNNESLESFAQTTYILLDAKKEIFPERFSKMFPYMISQNWLFNYSTLTGIENSFNGIFRRATYLEQNSSAFESFKKNYDTLKACYAVFFPELKAFSISVFENLLSKE